jgi:hypothetical protein
MKKIPSSQPQFVPDLFLRLNPIQSQIDADVKNCDPKLDRKCIPKLNADEALCKYGQSSKYKAEACRKVKAAGGDTSQAPQGKALGGAYAM